MHPTNKMHEPEIDILLLFSTGTMANIQMIFTIDVITGTVVLFYEQDS